MLLKLQKKYQKMYDFIFLYQLLAIRLIIHCLLIFLLCIMFYIFIYLIKMPIKKEYKINNWFETIFFVFIYISFFIIFLWILKFIRQTINILILWNNIILIKTGFFDLWIITKILYFCIFCCLIALWVLLFIKLHNKCKKEVIKLYLYIFSKNPLKFWEKITYFKLNFSVMGISYHFSDLKFKIISKIYQKYSYKILNKINTNLSKYIYFGIPKLHYILLIFCLSYDLYNSYFLLNLTTNFLPVYVIYLLWVNASNFIENQNPSINKILVELYYNTPDILYINLSEDEEYVLNHYSTTFNCPKELISFEDVMLLNPLIKLRRYIFLKGSKLGEKECDIYYNEFLHLGFNASDLIKKDDKYFVEEEKFYTMIFVTQEE